MMQMLLDTRTREAWPYRTRWCRPAGLCGIANHWRGRAAWYWGTEKIHECGGDAWSCARGQAEMRGITEDLPPRVPMSILPSSPPSFFFSVSFSQLCLDWAAGRYTCLGGSISCSSLLSRPSISRSLFPFLFIDFPLATRFPTCAPQFLIRAPRFPMRCSCMATPLSSKMPQTMHFDALLLRRTP